MIEEFGEIDEETMTADKAAVDAVVPDLETAWDAQVATISAEVSALPDEQKGKFLAPIARLPVGVDLQPEGLSPWGERYFSTKLREVRVVKLTPLYP